MVWTPVRSRSPQAVAQPRRYPTPSPPPCTPAFRLLPKNQVRDGGASSHTKNVQTCLFFFFGGGAMLNRERKRDFGSWALERGMVVARRLPPTCTPQIKQPHPFLSSVAPD